MLVDVFFCAAQWIFMNIDLSHIFKLIPMIRANNDDTNKIIKTTTTTKIIIITTTYDIGRCSGLSLHPAPKHADQVIGKL